jgi:hypothetical protein
VIWGVGALLLGKRYEVLRARQEATQGAQHLQSRTAVGL